MSQAYAGKRGQNPLVDFSLFGQHGLRILRKVRLTGLIFDRNGQMRTIKLLGPPTFEVWLGSWAVYRNALIMLDAVSLGALLEYEDMMKGYYDMHGARLWHLLYKCDYRSRTEHL